MNKPLANIILVMLFALHINAHAQCPGGASWFNTPVNGTLIDSGRLQVLDTINVRSTNPTFGSFAAGRPIYSNNALTWAANPYESITVIRGGGAGAATIFKLKTAVDSNIMHFRISDVRGDGFNAETQRILGYLNGVPVSATANDFTNGAAFNPVNGNITGGASTTGPVQSSLRIFFNGPVDSIVVRSVSFNDYVIIDLAARCDVILPVYKIDLSARNVSNGILLKWIITGEVKYFEIERSADQQSWTPMYSKSTGNYSHFIDLHPLKGTSYYRIKTIDESGVIKYSSIVQTKYLTNDIRGTLIYPNPFTNAVHFNAADKITAYSISSSTGSKILSKKIPGSNNFSELLPSSLPGGWYYFTVTFQNGEQRSLKLFKQ